MGIIDARVRLPQDKRAGSYTAPQRQTEQYDKVLDLTAKMNGGTLDGLLESLDGVGIERAVMHAESEGGEEAEALNTALAEVIAAAPDRFKGVGCVDIADARPGDVARQAARDAERGFVGVTIQPAFFGVDIDDRALYPLYARAEELGLVVCVHTGITYSRMHPLRHERAELLDQVACDFPDLRLVACHAGWPWSTEYAAVARRHPTVYLEFGGLAPKYVAKPGTGWDALFGMMPSVLRGQVLYGSDWPVIEPARAVREWRESGLDEAALAALLHDNAATLFGFPGRCHLMLALPNVIDGREVDIVELLHHQATRGPEHTFIHTPSATLTYRDVRAQSARLAGALAGLGVGKGTSVVVLMDNSAETVVVWFALARLGALHAPLNTALFGAALRHALAVVDSRFLIVDDRLYPHVRDVADGPAGFEAVVVRQTDSTAPVDGLRLADLVANGRPVDRSDGEPLDPATLLFTSGTTGPSKACVLSRRYLAAQGAAHARNLQLCAGDVLYCPFPLFHVDAATLTVIAALSVGATAALSPHFRTSRFWDEVRACGATVFDFMGATLSMLWKQPPSELDRRHRVRLAWGVPMPEWKEQWEERFGFPLYQLYGSTDAGVSVYDPIDGTQRTGSCGRVTDLYEVRTAPGGEILVRGRYPGLTMSGYYGMPAATAAAIDADGWVHTGDLGTLDPDGYLTFAGRLSDSIRRRGENISAFEVEELLLSHPAVLEVAAIGVPSELTEEDVKVCVVVRPGTDLEPRDLYEHCVQNAPKHMVPRYYEFVAALPKTPTEKVEKFRLKVVGINAATWDAETQ